MPTILEPLAHPSLASLSKSTDKANTISEKTLLLSDYWDSVKKNPLIDEQTDGTCNLTFLYRGNDDIEKISPGSSICGSNFFRDLKQIDGTDVWYLTIDSIPSDARITYQYFKKEWVGLLNIPSDFSEKEPQYTDFCSLFDREACLILYRDELYYADKDNETLKKIILNDDDSADGLFNPLLLKNIISNQAPGVIQSADEITDKLITSVTNHNRYIKPTPDPLNSYRIEALYKSNGDQCIAELPHAKQQPYVDRQNIPDTMNKIHAENRLIEKEIHFNQSTFLRDLDPYKADSLVEGLSEQQRAFRKTTNQGETRPYWVHLPPDYDQNHNPPYKVLIHLDGKETIESMKLPAIMETAPVEPTISIYVDVGNRGIEYGCGRDAESFADFLAKEFLPALRHDYPGMSSKAEDTTIAGFSMGGHAATQIGTRHPEVFGNVISQSGSFWMGGPNPGSGDFESTEGLLKKLEFNKYPNNEYAKQQCFYLNVGLLETAGYHSTPDGGQLQSPGDVQHDMANRNFAAFLKNNNIACEFETYSGDHCFAEWQNLLVEGLIKTRELQCIANPPVEKTFDKEPETLSDRIIALNNDSVINEQEYKAVIDSLAALTFPEQEKTRGVIASLMVAKNISPHLYIALEKDISALIKHELPTGYSDYFKSINTVDEQAGNDIDESTKDINSMSLKK